jgi:hypothetical protein
MDCRVDAGIGVRFGESAAQDRGFNRGARTRGPYLVERQCLELDEVGAAGKRLGYAFHQRELLRSGQQEPAVPAAIGVDDGLDVMKEGRHRTGPRRTRCSRPRGIHMC